MGRLGHGVSKVDWSTTFDFVVKPCCSPSPGAGPFTEYVTMLLAIPEAFELPEIYEFIESPSDVLARSKERDCQERERGPPWGGTGSLYTYRRDRVALHLFVQDLGLRVWGTPGPEASELPEIYEFIDSPSDVLARNPTPPP